MSWKAYEVLSTIPTFTPDPILGIGDVSRRSVNFGQAEDFFSWDGTTGLAFRFRYQPQSPSEWANMRDFFTRMKGRGVSFFIPTWQPDFELAESASIGDSTVTVVDAGFSDLTEDRPDTEKRVIFFLTPNLSFQSNRVISAVDDGANEILTLEDPLLIDLDVETSLAGFCYLSKLADNLTEFTATRPGRGYVDPRFLTVRNTRRVNDEQAVSSIDHGNAVAFESLTATDEDPIPYNLREAHALGPNYYAAPQGTAFFEDYTFTISGTDVTIERTDGLGFPPVISALYDSSFETEHLRACFDNVGREVLVWKISKSQFRIGHYDSGVVTQITIDGISPVAFYTWPIDSAAATAGDAEVVVYYIKPGFSSIFARLKSDDFSIEYQAIRTPSAPLYLHNAVKNGSFLEIQGVDIGHRRALWRARYVPPIRPDASSAVVSLTDGEARKILEIADVGSSAAAAETSLIDGAYRDLTIVLNAGSSAGASETSLIDGSYLNRIIDAPEQSESVGTELALSGLAYTLTAQKSSPIEGAAAETSLIEGNYSAP